jgi:hypothetical protein
MTIGILSSVKYDAKMKKAFQEGFKSTGAALPVFAPPQDSVGFKTAALDTAINTLITTSGVNMIVSFGGVAACKRMIAKSTYPFVSVVGTTSDLQVGGNFMGFVTFEDIKEDKGRVTWLANHVNGAVGGNNGNIGLYYNSTSSWGDDEANNFTGASSVAASAATLSAPSIATFSNDFAEFPDGTKAVVISAAGFFYANRETLIPAANSYGAYICYPLIGYENKDGTNPPTDQPTPGNAVIYGVDLDGRYSSSVAGSAYYVAGAMAAAVWNGGACNGTPNPQIQTAQRLVQTL